MLEIGDRVVVTGSHGFGDVVGLRDKRGTVIFISGDGNGEYDIGVEFDKPFPEGHDCAYGDDNPKGRNGCCRWGYKGHLVICEQTCEIPCMDIGFDEIEVSA